MKWASISLTGRVDSLARLTAEVWVSAYIARLRKEAIPVFVTSKGDATAGAVLIKVSRLDGTAQVFQRSFDIMTGERSWVVLKDGNERDVDSSIDAQRRFDPDLWVLEVEDRDGRHLLDTSGLAD